MLNDTLQSNINFIVTTHGMDYSPLIFMNSTSLPLMLHTPIHHCGLHFFFPIVTKKQIFLWSLKIELQQLKTINFIPNELSRTCIWYYPWNKRLHGTHALKFSFFYLGHTTTSRVSFSLKTCFQVTLHMIFMVRPCTPMTLARHFVLFLLL